jgi:hypothetical protein
VDTDAARVGAQPLNGCHLYEVYFIFPWISHPHTGFILNFLPECPKLLDSKLWPQEEPRSDDTAHSMELGSLLMAVLPVATMLVSGGHSYLLFFSG